MIVIAGLDPASRLRKARHSNTLRTTPIPIVSCGKQVVIVDQREFETGSKILDRRSDLNDREFRFFIPAGVTL